MKRKSTDGTEYREPLDGVKRKKEHLELASEQLPERMNQVSADGSLPLSQGGYKAFNVRIRRVHRKNCEKEWYRAGSETYPSSLNES